MSMHVHVGTLHSVSACIWSQHHSRSHVHHLLVLCALELSNQVDASILASCSPFLLQLDACAIAQSTQIGVQHPLLYRVRHCSTQPELDPTCRLKCCVNASTVDITADKALLTALLLSDASFKLGQVVQAAKFLLLFMFFFAFNFIDCFYVQWLLLTAYCLVPWPKR